MFTADKLPASLQELYEAEDDSYTSDTEPEFATEESDTELIDSEYEEDLTHTDSEHTDSEYLSCSDREDDDTLPETEDQN